MRLALMPLPVHSAPEHVRHGASRHAQVCTGPVINPNCLLPFLCIAGAHTNHSAMLLGPSNTPWKLSQISCSTAKTATTPMLYGAGDQPKLPAALPLYCWSRGGVDRSFLSNQWSCGPGSTPTIRQCSSDHRTRRGSYLRSPAALQKQQLY
jgi:hypothetical protein